jgi:hypothetical protein
LLALAISAGTTASNGAPVAGSVGVGGDDYDFAVRCEYSTGNGSNQAALQLSSGTDANNKSVLACYADGTLLWGYVAAGAFTQLGTVAGPSSGQRTGQQLWLRLTRRAGLVAYAWGVGSAGALPTAWTVAGTHATAAAVSVASGTYRVLQAWCASGATIPSGLLINVRAITYQALGGL